MKRNTLIAAAMLAATSLLAADPKDTVIAAAKKLADSGSYSWKQNIDMGGGGGFGGGETQGKFQNGLVWTSRSFNDNTIENLAKGTNTVTKNQEGQWQTPAEMAAARGGGGGGGGFGGRRGGGFGGAAVVPPATTAQELAGLAKSLTEANGVISGDLTEEGAKSQLTFGRRGGRGGRGGGGGGGGAAPEPTNAKASVKFWVKDGVLTKYELKSSGTMSFNDNEIQMDRTTTVDISNIGSTKIDAPAEAIKKIGG